jgi:hypothetical protein
LKDLARTAKKYLFIHRLDFMKTANPELEAWGFFIKEQKT